MVSLLLPVIYIAFISLGLPDSLLGSAWPVMYADLGAPVAAQSVITTIITAGTIVSSLATAPLMRRLGTGKLTAISVGMTAVSILGFAASTSLRQLCLLAVPYGLGAGSVDASLNNYVALHYGERHMSWLHCCWGVGTSVSPVIMGWALAGPLSWHAGYLAVGIMQVCITALLLFSLPLWKKAGDGAEKCEGAPAGDSAEKKLAALGAPADGEKPAAPAAPDVPAAAPSYAEVLRLPGAAAAILSFGCYSGFEYVCGLWSSSHLVMARGIAEAQAATMASFFYMGITAGRFLSGIVAPHVGSKNMIRLGQAIAAVGLVVFIVGQGQTVLSVALALIGLGCAPIYPSIISLTPERFGEKASQSMVSLQMACAYAGSTIMPPLVAWLVSAGGAGFMPWLLAGVLVAMFLLAEAANAKLSK